MTFISSRELSQMNPHVLEMEGGGSRTHNANLQLLTSPAGLIEAAILLFESPKSSHPFLESYHFTLALLSFILLVGEAGKFHNIHSHLWDEYTECIGTGS